MSSPSSTAAEASPAVASTAAAVTSTAANSSTANSSAISLSSLVPIKLVHFCFWGGQALIRPYYANLFNYVRLSSAEISFLLGTLPLFGLFTAPALGVLADRCGARKCGGGGSCGAPQCGAQRLLLTACIVLTIVGTQGLGLLTPREGFTFHGNLTGFDNEQNQNISTQNNDSSFTNENNNSFTNNTDSVLDPQYLPSPFGFTFDSTFLISLFCFIVIELSLTPIIALTDAVTFATLTAS